MCRLRLCAQSAMKVAQHLYTRTGFSRTPDLDFEPVPGITLRAYELALPPSPFPGRQPAGQPVWLSLARRKVGPLAVAAVTSNDRRQLAPAILKRECRIAEIMTVCAGNAC